MKKIIYIIASGLTLLGFSGCSDFLAEKSEDSFTAMTLFETPEGLEKMVISLYNCERDMVRGGNSNSFLGAHIYGERTTDLSVFLTGDDANLSRYTNAAPSSNVDGLLYDPFWAKRYYMIGRTNEIIHYGNKLGADAQDAVAEGSYWRAYCYYGLWVRFSRLYLSTEPVTQDNLEQLSYVPADSADVFKLMYSDLEIAINSLPMKSDPKMTGRVTKATARHLKALVAAWAKDWQEVANQIDKIESEKAETGLELVANPANIFNTPDYYGASQTETLFAIQFNKARGGGVGSDGTSGHRVGSQYVSLIADQIYTQPSATIKYTTENLGKQWTLTLPNHYLITRYPAGDKRLAAYYKIDYTYANPSNLITIPVAVETTDSNTGKKYWSTSNRTASPAAVKIGDVIHGRDLKAAGKTLPDRRALLPSSLKQVDIWTKPLDADGSISYKDIMVYRLSESYLLGAEAYMHLGNQTKAAYYYNKTWERAGNPSETRTITFDMIKDEHARELAFEGRRFEFLKRNGIWYSQMRSYSGDFFLFPTAAFTQFNKNTYGISDGRDPNFGPDPDYYVDFGSGSTNDVLVRFNVQPIHVNWPIPQSQINAMGPSFPQTDGYK